MSTTAGSVNIRTGFTIDTASYNRVQNQIKNISNSATSLSSGFKKIGSVAKNIGAAFGVAFSVKAIKNFTTECQKLYEVQFTAEKKLEVVMRQRMQSRKEDIESIKKYASVLQNLGVVGDEVQLTGAAQLATFLKQKETLKTLIPAMNNLLVAQYGLNSTTSSAYQIGNMMGKVMQGQVNSLRRIGITFSEAEAKVLKYGNEQQRAAMLAQIVKNNVGDMNNEMAKTPLGRQKQLSNVMGDLKEKVGQAAVNIGTIFLPILQRVAAWLDVIASVAIKVSTAIARVFGGTELKQSNSTLSSIPSETTGAVGGLEDLSDAYDDAGKAASKASKGVLGFDNVIQINKNSSSSSGASTTSGAGASVSSIGSALESEEVDGEINSISDKIKKTIDDIKSYLSVNVEMPNLDFNTELIKLDFINIIDNLKQIVKDAGTFVLDISFKFWNDIDGVGIIENAMILIYQISETLQQAVSSVTPALTTFYEVGIAPIVEWVGTKLKDALSFLGDQISKVGTWFVQNQELINNFGQTLGEIVSIVWGFIEPIADTVWEVFKTTISLIVDAMLNLATWLLENHKWILLIVAAIGEMWIIVQLPAIIGGIVSAVTSVIGVIKGAISVVTTIFGIIAANPLMLIPLAIAAIVTAIIYLWNTNEDFRNFIIGVWEKIKEVFGTVWEFIKSAASAGMEVLKGVVDFLVGGFQNGFESSLGTIGKLIDNWVGTIKDVFASVKDIFGGLIDFITGVFTGDWEKAFGGLKDVVTGIFKAVASVVLLPFKQIASVWNAIVDKIGTLTVPEWVPGIGGNSFNLPRITLPKLAQGGIVKSKTWAEIGEQGPEVVMPLRNTSFTAAFAEDLVKAQSKYNSSSNAVNINIYADKVIGNDWSQIAKEVKKALEKENIRVGGVSYAY